MLQNDTYETLILVTSGARHDRKFKRQNCGETLAHHSCVFLQSHVIVCDMEQKCSRDSDLHSHFLASLPLLWEACSVMGSLVQVSYLRNLSYPGSRLVRKSPLASFPKCLHVC